MARWACRRRDGRKPGASHIARLTTIIALVWGGAFLAATAHAVATCAPSATPANITMFPMSPSVVTADGISSATAVITLTDIGGNPVTGDACNLSVVATDGGVRAGPVADTGGGTYTVSVTSSTTAHQVLVTVNEVSAGIAATEPFNQVHGPAHTILVTLGSGVLVANGSSSTTATISVTDAHGNTIAGDALVMAASDPGVHFGPVTDQGGGVYTSTVFASTAPGSDTIRATDISASPRATGAAVLTETPAPSLVNVATMQWTFFYTRAYTVVRSLVVNKAPTGSSIVIACAGRGCPFSSLRLKTARQPRCSARSHGPCRAGSGLVLTPGLAHRRLHRGAHLTIAIVRPGWIGKFYGFRMRAATGPAVQISCLAPGGSRPGVGC